MLQKIKNQFLIASSLLTIAISAAVPALAVAAGPPSHGGGGGGGGGNTVNGCSNNNIAGQVATGANGAAGSSNIGCDATGVDNNSVSKLASNVVNVFSIIVGAVSIIMIIYGGFRYITSGGDSGSVGNAKNTLIYAIVGLIIVALAQVIVHVVLNQTNSAVNG
jgi:hypothetical protein